VVVATPVKKTRARPMSEQPLGRGRPKPMYEDDEGTLLIFLFSFNS
jgi:serine/arginine repetitive matrix protein 2